MQQQAPHLPPPGRTDMGLKHLHCWLMQRHSERTPGGDPRAKWCSECCWCGEDRVAKTIPGVVLAPRKRPDLVIEED